MYVDCIACVVVINSLLLPPYISEILLHSFTQACSICRVFGFIHHTFLHWQNKHSFRDKKAKFLGTVCKLEACELTSKTFIARLIHGKAMVAARSFEFISGIFRILEKYEYNLYCHVQDMSSENLLISAVC